jgi:hypothetical protein
MIQDQQNHAEDCMESIRFHLFVALSKGSTFKAKSSSDNIITALLPLIPQVDGEN